MKLTRPQQHLLNEGVLDWLDSLLQRVVKSKPPGDLPDNIQEIERKIEAHRQKLAKMDPDGKAAKSPLVKAVKDKILRFLGIQESKMAMSDAANMGIYILTAISNLTLVGITASQGSVGLAVTWGALAAANSVLATLHGVEQSRGEGFELADEEELNPEEASELLGQAMTRDRRQPT